MKIFNTILIFVLFAVPEVMALQLAGVPGDPFGTTVYDRYTSSGTIDAATLMGGYNAAGDYYTAADDLAVTEEDNGYVNVGGNGSPDRFVSQPVELTRPAYVTGVEFEIQKVYTTADYTVRIETDSNGEPSGTLVDVNATIDFTDTASGVKTLYFPGGITLAAGTYHIVWKFDCVHDYNVRIRTVESGVGGYPSVLLSEDCGASWIAEPAGTYVKYSILMGNNLSISSNAITADFAPKTMAVAVFCEGPGIAVNTDLKAYVSRDGGTTMGQVTLTDRGEYETGSNVSLYTGTLDVSGQPKGTDVRYKIETLNDKAVKIHGVNITHTKVSE